MRVYDYVDGEILSAEVDLNDEVRELYNNLKRYTLEKCIEKCDSLQAMLKFAKDDWYIISYFLYTRKEKSDDLLELLYDDRVLDLSDKFSTYLEELNFKRDISYVIDIIFYAEVNSFEVANYFVYKLLHISFPKNEKYKIEYDKSRVKRNYFITKKYNSYLHINSLSNTLNTLETSNTLKFLAIDKLELFTDLSNFNSLEEYYKSLLPNTFLFYKESIEEYLTSIRK